MIMLGIAGFELRRLCLTPFAWTVLAIVQFIHALVFYIFLSRYLEQPDAHSGHGLTAVVVAGFYQSSGLIMLLITPFLTMRLFSEEYRTGTIKLLLSAPVTVSSLVLGKFFGIFSFTLIIVIMISLIPASLMLGATLDYGQFIGAILGLVVLLGTFAAAGLFVSSLFRQPVIAAVCTFTLLILLWTIHLADGGESGSTASVAGYLSILYHYNNFTEGLFSSIDLVYFILMTMSFLLLGIWRIDAMRTHP
jgi:ABC-2 type transport system permease protein